MWQVILGRVNGTRSIMACIKLDRIFFDLHHELPILASNLQLFELDSIPFTTRHLSS
jgi:hypothetical protein